MENKLNDVYENKYGKQLDNKIPLDYGVFFLRVLSDELLFELKLAPASNVVIGCDETQLAYELTNIKLEYEVINSQKLADEDFSNYRNGKRFMYEQVTHLETNSVDKGLDTTINESINEGTSSVYEPYVAGARDSENV